MISASVTTIISASVAQTSVQIAPANAQRRFFMLYNNGANSCYINFGQAASGNTCSVIIPTFTTWSWPNNTVIYTGTINAIRNAGSGTIVVTEFNYPYLTT